MCVCVHVCGDSSKSTLLIGSLDLCEWTKGHGYSILKVNLSKMI